MKRIALTDGSGRWFDAGKAEVFEEDTFWNGQNHISRATGSQWNHEQLYRTAGGRWVLCHWSQWEGSSTSYTEQDPTAAAGWLVANGYDPHPALAVEYAGLELA